MNEMVDEIGKSVLGENEKYNDAVIKQNEKTIGFYTRKICNDIFFEKKYIFIDDVDKKKIFEVTQLFYDLVLNNPLAYDNVNDVAFIFNDVDKHIIYSFNIELKKISENLHVSISDFESILKTYKSKISNNSGESF